jgi:hypothetical protein
MRSVSLQPGAESIEKQREFVERLGATGQGAWSIACRDA